MADSNLHRARQTGIVPVVSVSGRAFVVIKKKISPPAAFFSFPLTHFPMDPRARACVLAGWLPVRAPWPHVRARWIGAAAATSQRRQQRASEPASSGSTRAMRCDRGDGGHGGSRTRRALVVLLCPALLPPRGRSNQVLVGGHHKNSCEQMGLVVNFLSPWCFLSGCFFYIFFGNLSE